MQTRRQMMFGLMQLVTFSYMRGLILQSDEAAGALAGPYCDE